MNTTTSTTAAPGVSRPKQLLTQNRELRAIGVWNWTLPAWAGRVKGHDEVVSDGL